jgi:hypothetical protein
MHSLFLLMIGVGRKDFATYLPVTPPSSTRVKARAFGQHTRGLSATNRHYQHRGHGKRRHLAFGTTGRVRGSPRAPDNIYSSARICRIAT